MWYGRAMVLSSTDDAGGAEKKAAVNMIGAVSPAARDRPRIEPVTTPGAAAGRTTRYVVRQRDAPSASDAWRRSLGTCRSASSVAVMMTGSVRHASVSDPERIEV